VTAPTTELRPTSCVASADVAVNLLWCVPGQVGGSEEYLVRQLLGLVADGAALWRPHLYVLDGFVEAHPDLAELVAVEVAPFGGRRRPRRVAGEATWLRSRSHRAALTHHGGGTAPPAAPAPYVLTIHDLQYLTFPEHFSRAKRAYLDQMIPRSVQHAAVVAVPSEYVRRTVVAAFGVPGDGDKVVVVPHGIEPALVEHVTAEGELRHRYALGDGPIVVYPAVTHTHKNHRFLLDLLREHWHDADLRLVLIGGVGDAEADITGCTDLRVCRLGRVPSADRNGLIAMAAAMVFPSRYEGFGAPLIEAMALGTPVVAADTTCIPDVVGDAGVVLPLDLDAWAGALDTVARHRREMVAAGRARAQMFTAATSGTALASAYAQALR
jgi:glycosyltransferase involved in cell wall biosynthesis